MDKTNETRTGQEELISSLLMACKLSRKYLQQAESEGALAACSLPVSCLLRQLDGVISKAESR